MQFKFTDLVLCCVMGLGLILVYFGVFSGGRLHRGLKLRTFGTKGACRLRARHRLRIQDGIYFGKAHRIAEIQEYNQDLINVICLYGLFFYSYLMELVSICFH